MSDLTARSPSQPAVVLGLTFLAISLTFALPFRLIPDSQLKAMSEHWSPEAGNVYAGAAWAGWAHFLYAFRGQGSVLARAQDDFRKGRLTAFLIILATVLLALYCLRWALGVALFGALVWVYFIDHFLKAEQTFDGKKPAMSRWLSSYQPLVTFAWLSIVLLDVGGVISHPWILWTVSCILGFLVLALGGWTRLVSGDVRTPLLSLFFVAEALVWGTVGRYGGPTFLAGVYVFHVAAGSYFHYLSSYFYANHRSQGKDKLMTVIAVVGVNLALFALGFAAIRFEGLAWLRPALGVEWFTLWVSLHLVASDLFPKIKAMRAKPS